MIRALLRLIGWRTNSPAALQRIARARQQARQRAADARAHHERCAEADAALRRATAAELAAQIGKEWPA